jgi:hypothetical protein
LGRNGSEGANKFRPDSVYLAFQKGKAGIDLVRLGVAVVRRPTLDDITNVYLTAFEFDGFDNARQKLAGCTDKGSALPIFLETGAFPDKNELGPGIAFTKNDPFTTAGQLAPLAVAQVATDLIQRFA